jgi:four helix bundle protein
MEKQWDLRLRTMDFAVATFTFCRTVPRTDEGRDVVRQLRRASASVAANYRALCRSSTDRVFAAKAATLIEEADEVGFWLELLVRIDTVSRKAVGDLRAEANELLAIFVASRKTVNARLEKARKTRTPNSKF